MTWRDCVIDVSHWNGRIDWKKVDSSIALVFVKATQGSHYTDPLFQTNRDAVYASGRLAIPYHFLTIDDPDAQVALFEECLFPGQPFALDWEGRAGHTATPADVEYIGEQLCNDMQVVRPIGYWGIIGSTPARPTETMNLWTRWVPRYIFPNAPHFEAIPPSWRDTVMAPLWQYTAEGEVADIDGYVNRSVWSGDSLDALKAWYLSFDANP